MLSTRPSGQWFQACALQNWGATSAMSTKKTYLITLYLVPPNNRLEHVKQLFRTLRGLEGVTLDERYGLVLISPKRNLYTVRMTGELDPIRLPSLHPDLIKSVHGDVRIGPSSGAE